jgi:Na+:H+ antiporter, NhaA family
MSVLRDFLESEAAGGLILMGAAALALVIANSPLSGFYFETLHSYVFGELAREIWAAG